jgi:hypothetical protein
MARLSTAFKYASLMFLIGFVLGSVRQLLVVPNTGLLMALKIETPIMIIASALAAAFLMRWHGAKENLAGRLFIGFFGLILLLIAENILALLAYGSSAFSYWGGLAPEAQILNFAGLIAFALMPILVGLFPARKYQHG